MKESLEDKFSVFIPIEIEKGGEGDDRYMNMRIKGIASTTKQGEDADGEILEPEGMDLSELLSSGTLNFHHQWTKDPLAIIGEPTRAEIRDGDLYIEGKLYPSSQKARDVYDLAEILEKDSSNRRLGFSIEGKALKRDPKNKGRILKSKLSAVAITPSPKCKGTRMDIMKGSVSDWGFEDSNGGHFESTEYLVDVFNEKNQRVTVDRNYAIKVWPIEKSITTSSIAPGTPESVEHNKKQVRVPQDNWPAHNKDNNLMKNSLTKANLYVQFLQEGYSKEDCKHLVKLVDAIEKGEIEYDLEKGGEGSRGGKVIGHTQSGKPIYEDLYNHHISKQAFTKQDHKDAYEAHTREYSRINNQSSPKNAKELLSKQKHNDSRNYHWNEMK